MDDLATRTVKLLDRRILLLLTIGMFLALFDRINVSYSALQMNQDLGFGPEVFGTAVAALFIGYALFEIPSAYVLVRAGARVWLPLILVVWGCATLAIAFVREPHSLYALRFIVGIAEAGFPACCAFVISQWYPRELRARAISRWMEGPLYALALAGPLSTGIMSIEFFGLRGWQSLFLAGGVPAILLGLLLTRRLAGGPAGAPWLPMESRQWLEHRRKVSLEETHSHDFVSAFRTPATWVYAANYILLNGAGQLLIFWMPQITRELWSSLSTLEIGFVGAVPLLLAIIGNRIAHASIKKLADTRRHLIFLVLSAATLLMLAAVTAQPLVVFIAISLGIAIFYVCTIILLGLPLVTLGGAAVAASVALLNTGGQLGSATGPYVMGWIRGVSGTYGGGIFAAGLSFLLAAIPPLFFGRYFPAPVRER